MLTVFSASADFLNTIIRLHYSTHAAHNARIFQNKSLTSLLYRVKLVAH